MNTMGVFNSILPTASQKAVERPVANNKASEKSSFSGVLKNQDQNEKKSLTNKDHPNNYSKIEQRSGDSKNDFSSSRSDVESLDSQSVKKEVSSIQEENVSENQPLNSDELQSSPQMNQVSSEMPSYPVISEPTQDLPVETRTLEEISANSENSPSLVELVKSSDQNKLDETTYSPLAQRAALQKFINRMKKDFDVEPQELVQAIAVLDTIDLVNPPEMSVDSIIKNLGLTGEDKEKAKLYFHEMLQQTASTSMADYLKETNSDLSIKILSKDEMRKAEINQGIDSLNNRFFVDSKSLQKNKEEGAATGILLGSESREPVKGLSNLNDILAQGPAKGPFSNGTSQGVMSESAPSASVNAMNFSPSISGEGVSSQGDFNLEGFESVNNLNESLETLSLPRQVVPSSEKGSSTLSQLNDGSVGVAGVSSDSLEAYTQDESSEEFSGEPESDFDSYVQVKSPNETNANTKSDFAIQSKPVSTEMDQAANVKEVVNNARLMMQKGGGEMTVRLTPEGLGEVTMKVNVENGKVNVEMLASNNDAKRVIERGLGELKATLASHKLSVDQIKVDTNNDILNDLNNRNNEAERQFAQQFMNNFSRDNQAWRSGFLGLSGARAYASQTEDDAQNPLLQIAAQRPKNTQRRLDLVA